MTEIAITSTPTQSTRRHGLWALVGSVLTLASMAGVWLSWRQLADQNLFTWAAVAFGAMGAVSSALGIAALNGCLESARNWRVRLALKMAKRLLLALQILCSLVAAGAAAALVFGYPIPRSR